MWKDKSSIQTKFLNKMMYIVFISVGLWCLIWIQGEYSTFKSESDSLRSNYIQSQKALLKNEVGSIVQNINTVRLQAEKKLERSLEERVNEAFQTAMYIYQQNVNSKSLPVIEKMIKDALRPVRFNDGRGYYFAVSLDGIEQLYPVKPEYEGKNLIELQDSKGIFVIQDEIGVIKRKGEGLVRHFWTKPEKDSTKLYEKVSFIKHFKPLNWYLGTGEYLDNAREQVQEQILKRLSNLRFGTEGYFFGSTYQGEALFSAGKINTSSGNIWELTDLNGVKVIQEQTKAAKNPEGDFVRYSWNKLNTKDLSPKISFVRGIPEWEWVIGAGVYLDTIETTISENKTALISGLKKRIARSMVILAVLLCLIYFWSKRISIQIQKSVDTFSSFLEKARTDSIIIDPDDIQLKEFKDIAISTNKMLKDRKKASDQLQKSEEKYRKIVENANESIVISQDGIFKFINSKTSEISGYSQQELISKSFIKLVHPDEQSMVMQHHIKRLRGEKIPEICELRFIAKNGNVKWVEDNGIIVEWEGKPATLNFFTDITDRKRVEESLKEIVMLLKETQKIAKMGGWEYDVQTNVATYTDMIFEIYGETFSNPEEGIKFYHIDDRMMVLQSFKNAVANNEPYDIEARFQNAQGDNLWVRTVGKPVVEDGKVVKVIGNLMDITELKKAENKLKRSSSILNATQQLAKIGGWELDQKTQSIFWTDEVYRIHGFLPDEFTSFEESVKLSMKCYDPGDQQIVVDAFKKCTEEGQAYDLELPFTTTKGRRIWIQTLAKPIIENGKVIKVVGCFMDITERKQLEEKLRQTQKMEAIGTLAGGIAHDFNNILFPIVGHTEMMIEDIPDDSPFKESLKEIYTSALRAKDLVQQILAFSRQENSELKLMKMQSIIKEALKLIRSTITTTITINQNLQPDCGAIKADPTQIHQIVMNLTTNAYHAMENDGGELKVVLKEVELGQQDLIHTDLTPGRYACLTISDTGIGITKDVIDKIFDPFFTTKEKGKGTGMGLSVVHGIIKNMNGKIEVDSELGKGTEFHVYLPIVENAFKIEESPIKEPMQGGDERILLVDDEEIIIKMETKALERLGYQVTSLTSSIEALEIFRTNPDKFDLIVTDMAMPKIPGNKLAAELIKIRPDIPILLCTGFSEAMTEEKVKSLGIKGLLLKPIIMKELARKIRETLDNT